MITRINWSVKAEDTVKVVVDDCCEIYSEQIFSLVFGKF